MTGSLSVPGLTGVCPGAVPPQVLCLVLIIISPVCCQVDAQLSDLGGEGHVSTQGVVKALPFWGCLDGRMGVLRREGCTAYGK